MQRLRAYANDAQLVLPGHVIPFTGLPTRMRQLIDNHDNALERLYETLKAPHTAVDCFRTLFVRDIRPAEYGLALVEAVAHLNHLLVLDKVSRTRRDNGAWIWQQKAK